MAWSYSFDVSTPSGSDKPFVIDDEIRLIKRALQERFDAWDIYFPLTGNEQIDTDACQHKKVTFCKPLTEDPAVPANKFVLYTKNVSNKAELFFRSEVDGMPKQLTSEGNWKIVIADLSPGTSTIVDDDTIEVDASNGIQIKALGVDTAQIAAGAVTAAKLASGQASQAVGSSDISETTGDWVDMTDMSIDLTTTGGKVLVMFSASMRTTEYHKGYLRLLVDTVEKHVVVWEVGSNAANHSTMMQWLATGLSSASHNFKVQWKKDDATNYQDGATYPRVLTAVELPF